ncbi:MAK10-like protein [Tanacetum coccineum]
MSKTNDSEFTVNEYLTKIRSDSGSGIVKQLFEENIKFEFWGQCIEELKENLFYGKNDEDPHEHISNITEIIDLFHSPDVSRDQVLENQLLYASLLICLGKRDCVERIPSGDENSIRTLGDYSKPSHEGYRNTIELPIGNNVLPLRSDTILLVQNGCSFHGLRSEDPNQLLKDFLKLVDYLTLTCEIDRAAGGKLRNKNTDESWEIIENLALYDHEGPSPQPQALDTTFEARVRDYMAAHTERMERFENTIFKQREEINGRMTEMFGLLKELTTSRTSKKVLIREEAKFPVTKNVNSISLTKGEEEGSNRTKVTPDNAEKLTKTEIEMLVKEVEKINEVEIGAGNKSIKKFESEEAPAQAGKKKGKEYKVLPGGPAYDAILKKKITKKEDIKGNFKIPCSIGNLKRVNALVDKGSDVNVMPYSTYMKLTDERPAETDIRLSLASHSYIYPLGIAEDVLVEIVEHVYPVDFVILDMRENENRPFIIGTPFLITTKASIKFDTGTITLRSGKHKVSFYRIPDSSNVTDKRVKNDIEPIAPTMTVNRLVLKWEEKIKLHLERKMQFNQWRSKKFKGMHPTPIATKEGMDDEGEVTLYLMRRSLEVLRKFHWMILGGRFNQLSHVSSPLLSKQGEY